MESIRATSQSGNNIASGSWKFKAPRRDNSLNNTRKPQPLFPIFNWKDAVIPGIEPRYLRRAIDVNEALELAEGPFGFDVEWKPNFIKGQAQSPIAVVQLARDDQILLIQLSAMCEFPERLREILENPAVVKAGVGIVDDAKKIWRDYGVSLLGAVELSHLARSADASRWATGKLHQLISLTRLLEAYQSRRLDKGKARMSNWELNLTPQQIDYAASDAVAGYIVYQHLKSLGSQAEPEAYTSDILAGKKQLAPKMQLSQRSSSSYIQSGIAIVADSTNSPETR